MTSDDYILRPRVASRDGSFGSLSWVHGWMDVLTGWEDEKKNKRNRKMSDMVAIGYCLDVYVVSTR